MEMTMRDITRLILSAVVVLGVPGVAMGGVDPVPFINYQGVLRDNNGIPENGIFDMAFRFFDAAVGGNEVLIDEHLSLGGVMVSGGLFNVALGSGAIFDGSGPGTFASLGDVFRRLSEVYLEVEVDGEPLNPRTRVLSAAYSVGDAPGDPPCFDGSNRFVDCSNGTVTDTVTGLIWLKDATCATLPGLGGSEFGNYQAANEAAAELADGECGLTDGSSPGDWRLPTDAEWQVIVDQANSNGCALYFPDTVGTGCCGVDPCAFAGVQSSFYWSSTTVASFPDRAWFGDLDNGLVNTFNKAINNFVWPVRAGP